MTVNVIVNPNLHFRARPKPLVAGPDTSTGHRLEPLDQIAPIAIAKSSIGALTSTSTGGHGAIRPGPRWPWCHWHVALQREVPYLRCTDPTPVSPKGDTRCNRQEMRFPTHWGWSGGRPPPGRGGVGRQPPNSQCMATPYPELRSNRKSDVRRDDREDVQVPVIMFDGWVVMVTLGVEFSENLKTLLTVVEVGFGAVGRLCVFKF